MAQALALVDDLFFQVRLLETARQTGVELKCYATGSALLAAVEGENPRLVIVDLNARQGPVEAVEALRAAGNRVPVVGFLSHVQTELAERARAAGCRDVLARSIFTQKLAAILSEAKS